MGWIDDVGAVGQDYALTGTFLWIGIMAGEPIVRSPVNYIFGIAADDRPINWLVDCLWRSYWRDACLSGQL
jgi:hypothetical protein